MQQPNQTSPTPSRWTRLKSFFGGAQEGEWRGPFLGTGELGTSFTMGPLEDGWQRHLNVGGWSARKVPMVYAAVMLYCRALSQCTPAHLVRNPSGAWVKSTTSPASRVLRRPNTYEHWGQYIYNIVADMLFEGESLSLKVYDERRAVTGLHRVPRGNWSVHIEPETKTPFYGLNDGEMYRSPEMLIPARDVVHFRQHCPRHPLIGESPVKAAAMAVGLTTTLSASQLAFFSQMSRPSGVLTTDNVLSRDQSLQLRAAFNEQSKGWSQGLIPILSAGLKWQPMNISQADSQLIEQQRLSAIDIARVFGVPMALLSENSGPQSGTESLISHWLSIGLGSVIETIERSLDQAFDLGAEERIELDPRPLLRVDFASRIDGLVKAVQGGIMTPREARDGEGLGEKEGDDTLYLQRQMTPMSLLDDLNQAELAARLAPPPPPAAPEPEPTEPEKPAESEKPAEPEKSADAAIAKALVYEMLHGRMQ